MVTVCSAMAMDLRLTVYQSMLLRLLLMLSIGLHHLARGFCSLYTMSGGMLNFARSLTHSNCVRLNNI